MRSKSKSRKERKNDRDEELDELIEDLPRQAPSEEDKFNDTCDEHECERDAQPLHMNRPVEIWSLHKMHGDNGQKIKTFYCQDGEVTETGAFIGKMFRKTRFGLSKYLSVVVKMPEGSYLKFEGVLSYREYLKLPEEDQTPMLPYID